MKRKFIIPVLIATLLLILTLTACSKNDDGQEPLPAKTVQIFTAAELAGINEYVGDKYKNYVFELQNDISLASFDSWNPIGSSAENAFCGKFDGKGKKITDLMVAGWDENGVPIFTTSYAGLFGYTKSAKIIDLALENINLNVYTDGVAAYVGGLTAYNFGDSEFNNISVSGVINVSNIYTEEITYTMEGVKLDAKTTCRMQQYIGGVAAYSAGATTFKNVSANITIKNSIYNAIYAQANEEFGFEEGYIVISESNDSDKMPEQVFAGLGIGLVKDASLEEITVSGNIRIKSKSDYAGGIVAAAYNSVLSEINESDIKIESYASTKNTMGGIVGLLDNSVLDNKDGSVSDIELTAQAIGSVQSSTAGGAVGYLMDNAVLKNTDVTGFIMNIYDKSVIVGGLAGVLRDSIMTDCTLTDGKYFVSGLTKEEDFNKFFTAAEGTYIGTAAVFHTAFGNADIADCSAEVKNYYGTMTVSPDPANFRSNVRAHFVTNTVPYFNKDGKEVIKLANKDNVKEFILVYAEVRGANTPFEVQLTVYDEEVRDIVSYSVHSELLPVAGTPACRRYLDEYFTGGTGLVHGANILQLIPGRNLNNYIYLTGAPVVDTATVIAI